MMTWARHPIPDEMHNNFRHSVDDRNIRFQMHFDSGEVWNYHDSRTWGKLQLVENVNQIYDDPQIQRYGPDWLKDRPLAVLKIMRYNQLSKRSIKDVLTDQTISAGVGNYLAVEACHRAQIHPLTPRILMFAARLAPLLTKVGLLIDESLKKDNHDHWLVFEKAGQVCPTCHQGIIQYVKDGKTAKRGSYFCPICQPGPEV
jgi:formamidopyrimidine-DNA glycosylase